MELVQLYFDFPTIKRRGNYYYYYYWLQPFVLRSGVTYRSSLQLQQKCGPRDVTSFIRPAVSLSLSFSTLPTSRSLSQLTVAPLILVCASYFKIFNPFNRTPFIFIVLKNIGLTRKEGFIKFGFLLLGRSVFFRLSCKTLYNFLPSCATINIFRSGRRDQRAPPTPPGGSNIKFSAHKTQTCRP